MGIKLNLTPYLRLTCLFNKFHYQLDMNANSYMDIEINLKVLVIIVIIWTKLKRFLDKNHTWQSCFNSMLIHFKTHGFSITVSKTS